MNNPALEAININFLDMPSRIQEHVICNEDGSFSIFINSRLNWESQMIAYQHAVRHIAEMDFEKYNADDIESAM